MRDGKRTEITDQRPNEPPIKCLVECHKAQLSAKRQAYPNWVDIGLVVGRDQEAASVGWRNVLTSTVSDEPECLADDVSDKAQDIHYQLRRIFYRPELFHKKKNRSRGPGSNLVSNLTRFK